MNDPEAHMGMAARHPRPFAFGAATGPFGLIATAQPYPRVLWDALPDGTLCPLYHVARWISQAAGADLLQADAKDGVAQVVWRKARRRLALIANLTPLARVMSAVDFAGSEANLMDCASLMDFAQAAGAQAPPVHPLPKTSDAYTVVFMAETGARP